MQEHEDGVQEGGPAGEELDWFEPQDPEQVRLLTSPGSRRFFEPFLARTRSVGEAAREVGCNLDTMLYRVRQFERAGLLVEVGRRPRAGRPIRLYRSNAAGYRLPFSLTPFATLEEQLYAVKDPVHREIAAVTARLLRANDHHYRRLYRGRDGSVWSDAALGPEGTLQLELPGAPPATDYNTVLKLDQETARQLLGELLSIFERYSELQKPGASDYLLNVALLPRR